MFSNFKKTKNYTKEDLKKELLKPVFNLNNIEEIYKSYPNISDTNENMESLLHLCVKKNLYEACKWLLEKKIDINMQNDEEITALFYTVYLRNTNILKLFIEYNVDIDEVNNYKRTLLQESVIVSNARLVDFLLPLSKNINNCDIYGNNIIFDAVANGSESLLRTVASIKGVNINQVNKENKTILQKEAVLINNKLAMILMELGADPTIIDQNGKNFLFYAVSQGIKNEEIIDKAISLGCNINSRSQFNTSILIESIDNYLLEEDTNKKNEHLQMLEKLLLAGVQINVLDEDGESEFFKIIRSEDEILIDLFLKIKTIPNEINIDQQNSKGETILMIMALRGIKSIKFISNLLTLTNPNIKDEKNETVIVKLLNIILHLQSKKKIDIHLKNQINKNAEYISVLKVIIENTKADLRDYDHKGKPLFYSSILYFNFPLFVILKSFGANINQNDKEGHNIIYNILEHYEKNEDTSSNTKEIYLETLQNLINLKVDINQKDDKGGTALHKAVSGNCEYTVKTLLEAKPDFYAVDKQGRSVIHACIWKDTSRYFKLIHSYNKEVINIADSYGIRPINYAAFMGKNELVLDMLKAGALINNENKIDEKMLKFFEKFHKNIKDLVELDDNRANKLNLNLLLSSMKKEFNIK